MDRQSWRNCKGSNNYRNLKKGIFFTVIKLALELSDRHFFLFPIGRYRFWFKKKKKHIEIERHSLTYFFFLSVVLKDNRFILESFKVESDPPKSYISPPPDILSSLSRKAWRNRKTKHPTTTITTRFAPNAIIRREQRLFLLGGRKEKEKKKNAKNSLKPALAVEFFFSSNLQIHIYKFRFI